MASFEKAQAYVKKAEGGYSADRDDCGNYNTKADCNAKINFVGTNFGISAPVLSTWLGHTSTESDMRSLTYETALKIYRKNYWNIINGDNIKNQSIATLLYDSAVNQYSGAYKTVSKALGINARFPFDKTVIDSINNYPNQQELFEKMKVARMATYNSSSPYYSAWIDRVKKIIYETSEEVTDIVKKNTLLIVLMGVLTVALTVTLIYRKPIINYLNS